MNYRKKKKLLSLIKQYKRSSRRMLKQYKDIDYFETVRMDKIFKPIIKLIEGKMKLFNDILKFDLKVESKNFTDERIVNKYHDYNIKIVNKLDLSNKEKTTLKLKLMGLNRIGIEINYGMKDGDYVTPYVYVVAPQGNGTFEFEESKSKKLVADVQKYLMNAVNDTVHDIIKISKKIKNEDFI